MVVAEHPTAAGQSVVEQGAGAGRIPQRPQVFGEVVRRVQRAEVVVAEQPLAAGQGFLVQDTEPPRVRWRLRGLRALEQT